MGSFNSVKYGWVEVGVVGASSVLNTEVEIEVVSIMVGDPKDWSVLSVDLKKRICGSFDDCEVPLYEFLFTMIGFQMPLSDFKVSILKLRKVSPS